MTDRKHEPPRKRRADLTGRIRFVGLVLLALAIGTVLPQLLGEDSDSPGIFPGESVETQQVAAWALHQEGGESYIAVFATGGKPSLALAVPADVTINLPGQNLGTLAEAAASGDEGLVEVSLENLLGAPLDATVLAPISSVERIVDDLGGLEVRDREMSGSDVIAYLTNIPDDAAVDLPFLRWQDVLEALIAEAPGQSDVLPQPLGEYLDEEPDTFTALPVVDIGGGLLRPEKDEMAKLLKEHFVPSAADATRLVVLNGVGTPGIGEEVARILVPQGFQLVSSGNANTFDLEVTQIIASSRGDIRAAERAKELLDAGEVSLGNQPAGLADVTVVVGRDFGGS